MFVVGWRFYPCYVGTPDAFSREIIHHSHSRQMELEIHIAQGRYKTCSLVIKQTGRAFPVRNHSAKRNPYPVIEIHLSGEETQRIRSAFGKLPKRRIQGAKNKTPVYYWPKGRRPRPLSIGGGVNPMPGIRRSET